MSDTQFGDFDPEDAYDAGDAPEMRLAVLEKVVANLRETRQDGRFVDRKIDFMRVINNFLNEGSGDGSRLQELKAEVEAL